MQVNLVVSKHESMAKIVKKWFDTNMHLNWNASFECFLTHEYPDVNNKGAQSTLVRPFCPYTVEAL